MTFARIICPDCKRPLLVIEAEAGSGPLRVTRNGTVNIRCPDCMDWKNVVEQLDVFRPPPSAEVPNAG